CVPQLEIGIDAKLLRGVMRPERIVKSLPANRDEISLFCLEDPFGLVSIENQSDCDGGDIRAAPDRGGIGNLIARIALGVLERGGLTQAARGAIDDVDAAMLQFARDIDRILNLPTLRMSINTRYPKDKRLVLRPTRAHRVRHL